MDEIVLDLNIIVNIIVAVGISVFFKFIAVPKIERRYARNEFNVLMGTMGFVKSFDYTFQFFYELFEREIKPIRELRKDQWKPRMYGQEIRINETENTHSEINDYADSEKKILKNLIFYRDNFDYNLEGLHVERDRIMDYIEKNESYLDPVLRLNIERYTLWTITYVEQLLKGWNKINLLQKRSEYAFQIIKVLKNEQDIPNKIKYALHLQSNIDKSHIGDFIDKWESYENNTD